MKSMMTLLEPILKDAQSMPFPVEFIRKELTHMLLSQDEFQYFMEQSFKNLRKTYGDIVASTFLECMQREMKINTDNIFNLDYESYALRVISLISLLESIRITMIPRDSPDYEVVKELSKI